MKKLLCTLLALTLILGMFSFAAAEEAGLLVIDGKPAKVVYISNECASDWQASRHWWRQRAAPAKSTTPRTIPLRRRKCCWTALCCSRM